VTNPHLHPTDADIGWLRHIPKTYTRFNRAITSVNVHQFQPHFHCYNKKCMTHKSNITPATSPLFCNHPT